MKIFARHKTNNSYQNVCMYEEIHFIQAHTSLCVCVFSIAV